MQYTKSLSFFFSIVLFFVVAFLTKKGGGQQMKLNKRLFGLVAAATAIGLPMASQRQQRHNQGANSRRVKDMVSQPKQKTGASSECSGIFKSLYFYACPRLRLILPDPTAIRVGLSHASRHSNVWHTAQ